NGADVKIGWIFRASISPGESALMYGAVRSLSLPASRTFAGSAAETLASATSRRSPPRAVGRPQAAAGGAAYWRRRPSSPAGPRAAEDSAGAGPPVEASVAPSPPSDAAGPASEDSAAPAAGAPAAGASEDRPEPEGTLDVLHQVHEMTELLPPI